MHISLDRLMQTIEAMAHFGATAAGGVTRPALSDADRDARNQLAAWFEEAGMTVRIDDFGNQIAHRAGKQHIAPIVLGSHSDSVPFGGRYDGILGLLAALEVVRSLNDHHIETGHPIEIVNWTGEEGSRFIPSLMGSRGVFGLHDAQVAWECRDDDGIRLYDELVRIGYLGEAVNRPREMAAYLELHIEQGPVLEAEHSPVGIVQGIIGQTWHEIIVSGRAGHAGANPMNLRADALVAAAAMIQETQRLAHNGEGYTVATVGKLSVHPGAMNVVPSRVQFWVDARAARAEDLAMIDAGLRQIAREVEHREGVSVQIDSGDVSVTTPFDPAVMAAIRDAIQADGLPARELWSGAGHDAQVAALHVPAGMIFVRSKDGLSHAEAEYSSPEDIEAATNVLLHTVMTLAK